MVAGVIGINFKSNLKFWRTTNINPSLDFRVDSIAYKDFIQDVEEEIVNLPVLPDLPIKLQLDGAGPHKGEALKHFRSEDTIFDMEFQPSRSPDLNAIEFIWNILKKKVYSQPFNTLNQLISLIQQAWDEISFETINNVIGHVKKRALYVLEKEGRWY